MDTVSRKKRSEIMSRIKSTETGLETKLRKRLWCEGIRYRKNLKGYFGNPDLVIKLKKVAIFIDSCFWHGCKRHLRMPKSNRAYWEKKIDRNKKRDKEVNKHYKREGWRVFRIWEHEITEDKSLEKALSKIKAALS